MKIVLGFIAVVIVGVGVWWALSLPGRGSTDSDTYSSGDMTLTFSTTTQPAGLSNNPSPASANSPQAGSGQTNQAKIMQATLHTNKGDITIEFDSAAAPNTTANFIKLAQAGFYDGTKFHRVIKGFMDQGGDPLSKDDSKAAQWGTGGPGYQFADENQQAANLTGVVSMANAGPNTNGSQFFINAADNNFLNGKYNVFGKVVAGLDVVMAINNTPTDGNDRPLEPVIINSISLK